MSAGDVERLSCRANNRKPLTVLKKVEKLILFFFCILKLFGNILKRYFQYYIITATKTHHLLSTELCEQGDQPMSTQRGGSVAATDAGTHKGKTNVELKCECTLSPVETLR